MKPLNTLYFGRPQCNTTYKGAGCRRFTKKKRDFTGYQLGKEYCLFINILLINISLSHIELVKLLKIYK